MIQMHAAQIVRQRLADAQPKNDGKQTPMRGRTQWASGLYRPACDRNLLQRLSGEMARNPEGETFDRRRAGTRGGCTDEVDRATDINIEI